MNGQLLKFFAWALTWKASLDCSLEIFKPFDGCRLDGLEELKPDNWKGIVVIELFRNLVAQIGLERRQQEGPSRFVVRAVVLVVIGDLAFNQGLCRLNGVAAWALTTFVIFVASNGSLRYEMESMPVLVRWFQTEFWNAMRSLVGLKVSLRPVRR